MKKALIIGLLLGVGLPAGLAADKSVVSAIEKSGGLVLPWPGEQDAWEVEFHLRGRDLEDDGLSAVAALKTVVALNLRDTKITSEGLTHLNGLS